MQLYRERPPADLTARARIVDAALAQFAARGPSRTTLKAIAEAAGVSVGLVQHHFGTKDRLREACDERVLALVRLKVERIRPDGDVVDPNFIGALYDAASPVMPYVGRAALEDDGRSAVLFAEVAELTAQYLTAQWPERFEPGSARTRAAAAAMLAMNIGLVVQHHQIVRLLDLEPDDPVPSPRVSLGALDVYQAIGELLASPFGKQFRGAVDTFYEAHQGQQHHESDPGPTP